MSGPHFALLAPLAALLATGCSKPPAVAVPQAPPVRPASVDGAVTEARLPVVTLTPEAERRIGLATTTVTEREVARRRTLPGVASFAAGRRATLVAPLAARVETPGDAKAVVAGSDVAAGQVLWKLVLMQPDAVLQRGTASRDLAVARAAFDTAVARQRRAEQLLGDQSGSVRAVEEAKLAVATATADLDAATAQVATWEQSQLRADGTLLLASPLGGIVLACDVVPGQIVAAGAVLAQIGALDPLWIHVAVHAAEVGDVDPRAPARVHPLGDSEDSPWCEAPVAAAPPAADTATGTVDLVYELHLGELTLRPGQRVLATLALRGAAKRAIVPRSALVRDAHGGSWVYVRRTEHAFVRHRVDVAWVDGDDAVLDTGPASGAAVVTAGAAELFGAEFGQGK